MNTAEARQIVQDGLDQKKVIRFEKEEALENFGQEIIFGVNKNHADAAKRRINRENREIIRSMARNKQREQARKEAASMRAVQLYGYACIAALFLSAWTKFPLWAALALILGGAVFPSVYIFRLYYPMEG